MIIDCISDLHGHFPKIEGGDLLIVAGDLTARHEIEEFENFARWLGLQQYKKKVVIGGNHDNILEREGASLLKWADCDYLCDSGTEFDLLDIDKDGVTIVRKKIKIWGSPWTTCFEGVNPKCTAFMLKTEEELAKKWALIPDDTDILVTHSPARGILDKTAGGDYVGCDTLYRRLNRLDQLKLHVFGHIHECGGQTWKLLDFDFVPMVNASIVNERYEPVNKPVRVIL